MLETCPRRRPFPGESFELGRVRSSFCRQFDARHCAMTQGRGICANSFACQRGEVAAPRVHGRLGGWVEGNDRRSSNSGLVRIGPQAVRQRCQFEAGKLTFLFDSTIDYHRDAIPQNFAEWITSEFAGKSFHVRTDLPSSSRMNLPWWKRNWLAPDVG